MLQTFKYNCSPFEDKHCVTCFMCSLVHTEKVLYSSLERSVEAFEYGSTGSTENITK